MYNITLLLDFTCYNIVWITIQLYCINGVMYYMISPDSDVYLSLNDVFIPNHGYVVIDDISMPWATDPTLLVCHTNRPPPTGAHSGGDWISPTDITVGGLIGPSSGSVPGLGRNRDPMEVRLWRQSGTPAVGIYRCEVMDASNILQTVYVGLYNDDGGGNVLYV